MLGLKDVPITHTQSILHLLLFNRFFIIDTFCDMTLILTLVPSMIVYDLKDGHCWSCHLPRFFHLTDYFNSNTANRYRACYSNFSLLKYNSETFTHYRATFSHTLSPYFRLDTKTLSPIINSSLNFHSLGPILH